VKASESGMCNMHLAPPFRTSTNVFKYTTEELRSATTWYATGNEVSKLCPALGSKEATPISGSGVLSNNAA
jgi:hypothetical protein